MKAVAKQKREGYAKHARNFQSVQCVFAEDFQHIGQQRDAAPEQDEADNVEWRRFCFAIIGKMQVDEHQPEKANRHIQKEYRPPMEVSHYETPSERPKHWAYEPWNCHEAHRADQLRFRIGPDECEATDGHHHRSTKSLKHAARHQQMDVARDSA